MWDKIWYCTRLLVVWDFLAIIYLCISSIVQYVIMMYSICCIGWNFYSFYMYQWCIKKLYWWCWLTSTWSCSSFDICIRYVIFSIKCAKLHCVLMMYCENLCKIYVISGNLPQWYSYYWCIRFFSHDEVPFGTYILQIVTFDAHV